MKRVLLGVMFFILAGAARGYGADQERVRVYMNPSMSSAPMIIANEEGFFKERGIDIEFIKSQSTADALLFLLQGSVDAIDGPLTAGIYNAVKEKQPVRIVAGTTQYVKGNDFSGILIQKVPGLPEDRAGLLKYLAAQKIALPIRGSMPQYFIETLFERHGLAAENAGFQTMSFPFIVEGMASGSLNAGFLIEPFISMARKKGSGFEFISLSDDFPATPASFVFYGANFVQKKKDLGVRFMQAYLKGCRQYALGKTPRNVELLTKALTLDEKVLSHMVWPAISPDVFQPRPAVVQDFQAWLIKKLFLSSAIDTADMFDASFLNKAAKE
ncbi:MAG: ABC transporter substrate-binding protein [Candidatus Omnitrophica bacterium]|nr:ABC transporter substrate-binding protein [Candidatus Omnitrophota bacterium]